jgi:hypothetical protein
MVEENRTRSAEGGALFSNEIPVTVLFIGAKSRRKRPRSAAWHPQSKVNAAEH